MHAELVLAERCESLALEEAIDQRAFGRMDLAVGGDDRYERVDDGARRRGRRRRQGRNDLAAGWLHSGRRERRLRIGVEERLRIRGAYARSDRSCERVGRRVGERRLWIGHRDVGLESRRRRRSLVATARRPHAHVREGIGDDLEGLPAVDSLHERRETGIAEDGLAEGFARGPLLACSPRVERRDERRLRAELCRGCNEPGGRRGSALRASTVVERARAELGHARGATVGGDLAHVPGGGVVERALVLDAAQLAARRRGDAEPTRRNERVVELDDTCLQPARRAVGAELDGGGTSSHGARLSYQQIKASCLPRASRCRGTCRSR